MAEDTLYEVLGVPETATTEEIRAAFRRLSKQLHPDQGGSPALFRRVQDAYETLSDPGRRNAYDQTRRGGTTSSATNADSGWVRVDEPTGGGYPPPGQPPPRPGAWAPPRDEPGDQPAAAEPVDGGRAHAFFARHPAGAVALMGLGVLLVGGAAGASAAGSGIRGLGYFVLFCGLVAMIGTRRAMWRYQALRSGVNSVDAMSGQQFEMLLEALFVEKGYRVKRTGGRGDFGADLVLEGSGAGRRTVVQAKRWTGVVRHDAVQQAVAAIAHYRATDAMVVTTSSFSTHARQLAQSNRVALWDRPVLQRELASMRSLPLPSPTHRFFSSLGWGFVVALGAMARFVEAGSRSGSRRRSSRRRW